ncbi:MAG: hemerythrin domain-containing protein [Candidatus Pacearchaeota archaeon]
MYEKIRQKMLEEHGRIDSMLSEFEGSLNSKNAEEIFNRFKWNLEKHFFIEERAIFAMHNNTNECEISDTFKLMQEHGEILALLKTIESKIKSNSIEDISNLKNVLKKHVEFENIYFYPNLEKNLNEQQKKEIVDRVEEIIRD